MAVQEGYFLVTFSNFTKGVSFGLSQGAKSQAGTAAPLLLMMLSQFAE
jgi:hypothetical protein